MPDITITEDSIRVAAFTSTVDGFDLDRAVSDLARLREIRQALAMWEGELTDWLADALGRNATDVDGVGRVEVKRGANRKEWDNDSLWRVVVSKARDERIANEMTGEYESEGEAVARVLADCMRPSWRLTPLKDRGIDPDEFCSVSPGKTSVVITPVADDAGEEAA